MALLIEDSSRAYDSMTGATMSGNHEQGHCQSGASWQYKNAFDSNANHLRQSICP